MEGKFENLSPSEVALAGASSGLFSRALIQPFDVLKIRFQLQMEPISKHSMSKYSSLMQATKMIYKEEGLSAFWKGHVPAQFLSIVFGLTQFWCYEMLVFKFKNTTIGQHHAMTNFICGSVAGTAATFTSFPFDVMRTRLIAQSEDNKVYKGLLNGYIHIFKHEGIAGYYRGITPTILAVAPNAGCQFMFYKFFDGVYKKIVIVEKDSYNVTGSMFSGSLAGLASKTLLYPLDITRKRMQLQGFQKYRKKFGENFICYNMRDCLTRIYVYEGLPGLFKGMSPSIIKALVASALNFTTFEMVCTSLNNLHKVKYE